MAKISVGESFENINEVCKKLDITLPPKEQYYFQPKELIDTCCYVWSPYLDCGREHYGWTNNTSSDGTVITEYNSDIKEIDIEETKHLGRILITFGRDNQKKCIFKGIFIFNGRLDNHSVCFKKISDAFEHKGALHLSFFAIL